MKENWTYKKFEDCLDKVKNTSKVPSLDYLDDGLFPIISQEEGLISGYWNEEADVFKVHKPVVIFGDHTRVLKYVDFDFVLGADGVKILQPIDGLSAKFLLYYLTWSNIPSLGYSRHYKLLKELDIPVPPIETQSRIVSELDLLQSIMDKQQAQLKELDKLAQAVFYDMFGDPVENEKGWESKPLSDISQRISNGYNAKLKEDTYKSEGVMYFRCQNVWRNRFDYTDLVYIDEETNELMKSSSLKHNDLLITKIGRINTENSSLGRVSLYEGEDDKANLSGNLCFIRLKDGIIHKFILYILISDIFRDYIRKTTVGGIDKRALNVKQIGSFRIILPPLSLQQSFAAKIESIEKQKAAIGQSMAETQKLFDYTMDKYFG